MSGVVHECLVCREQFKTAKEHLMHLPSHPELQGGSMSANRFLVFEFDYDEGYGWCGFKSAHPTLDEAKAATVPLRIGFHSGAFVPVVRAYGGHIVDLDTLAIVCVWRWAPEEGWVAP